MSVKKKVDTIFYVNKYWDYEGSERWLRAQKSKLPRYKFRPRIAELLAMEGVYDNPTYPDYKIHISCRFNDILRAGNTKHFVSCFRNDSEERIQPFLRCVKDNWAVMFVTDKGGQFMARCWIKYNRLDPEMYGSDYLYLYRRYGNKLGENDVYSLLNKLTMSLTPGRQVQIVGGQSDDYLFFG